MKTKDVVVGQCYETRIGGSLVCVRVTDQTHPTPRAKGEWTWGQMWNRRHSVRRFVVQRVDNGRVLPKARVAAALHEISAPPASCPSPVLS